MCYVRMVDVKVTKKCFTAILYLIEVIKIEYN